MSEQLRAMRAYVWERYKGRCCYCLRKLRRAEATVDHWIPQAAGGTNKRENLRLACAPCNGDKADTLPQHYRPRVVHAASASDAIEVRNALLRRCAPRGAA